MEQIKKLFSKTTRRGRAIRTAIQALIGVTSFVLAIAGIPNVDQLFGQLGFEIQLPILAAWTGVVCYIQNALEDFLGWLGN